MIIWGSKVRWMSWARFSFVCQVVFAKFGLAFPCNFPYWFLITCEGSTFRPSEFFPKLLNGPERYGEFYCKLWCRFPRLSSRIKNFQRPPGAVLVVEVKVSWPESSKPILTSSNIKNTVSRANRLSRLHKVFFQLKLVWHAISEMRFFGSHFKMGEKSNEKTFWTT